MLSSLRGVLALLLLVLNTLVWTLPLFAGALLKLLVPFDSFHRRLDPILNKLANAWVACNGLWIAAPRRWRVEGETGLDPRGWYLVNCNHQSWVDIFVLQHVLRGRIPMLKFFLKQELIYVPVIGLAWWALGFPFMRRHGKDALRRRPELRQQDHEVTLRACRRFSLVPTSVMNFAEGTRFTAAKHQSQGSPYRHLLKPRAGAMALTLNAMGDRFHSMVDATIVYPDGVPSFWDFLCGRGGRIALHVRQVAIPDGFATADYAKDPGFRRAFTRWLTGVWQEKDGKFDELLQAAGAAPSAGERVQGQVPLRGEPVEVGPRS
jgi:1-acyl-sn-glycerol-3-phosphate acyltransferase